MQRPSLVRSGIPLSISAAGRKGGVAEGGSSGGALLWRTAARLLGSLRCSNSNLYVL